MATELLERIGLVSWAPTFVDEGFDDLSYLMSLDSSRLRAICDQLGLSASEADTFVSGIRTEAEQAHQDDQDPAGSSASDAIEELRRELALQQGEVGKRPVAPPGVTEDQQIWTRLDTL